MNDSPVQIAAQIYMTDREQCDSYFIAFFHSGGAAGIAKSNRDCFPKGMLRDRTVSPSSQCQLRPVF